MQTIKIVEEKAHKSKYNQLDLLSKHRNSIMGFAALLILFFHSWLPIFNTIPIIGEIENIFKKISFCGVDIFFFMSGIGLTFSISNHSISEFYYKRLKRVLIPFLLITIIIRHYF